MSTQAEEEGGAGGHGNYRQPKERPCGGVEKERERGREGMLAAEWWVLGGTSGALRPRLAAETLEKDGANENGRGLRRLEATRFLHPSNSIYRR
jgi:hypothetical protein